MRKIECELAIAGGGPAGMASAIGAADMGLSDIIVIERDDHLGGILNQCIHNGFGLHFFNEDLTGPEYAERFISEIKRRFIKYLLRTMVIELKDDKCLIAVSPNGLVEIKPRALVLAMGCRERTRGATRIPGYRPAGVMTAGTAQRYINIEGYLPGKEIIILGSGDIGMIMARRLHLEGCVVKGVVEIGNFAGGLTRNYVQCIEDYDIPLYLGHTITNILGEERVEAVEITPINADGIPDSSKKFIETCDTLLLSVGLIPENELSRQANILLDPITGGPLLDQYFQTSLSGVFAAGNVAQVFDLVDHVSDSGKKAGENAALYLRGEIPPWGKETASVIPGEGVRCVMPQKLTENCQGKLNFYLRASTHRRMVLLDFSASDNRIIYSEKINIVRPPEMINIAIENVDITPSGKYYFTIKEEYL
ncbi:MAG: pyridine nucleotide-disulfide oxidoreductase [Spirochaetes bacterium]|nr:MAG: pyridine nucleotide-disulfide oxidoreductase [Spirochaetota bacterium]